MVSSTDGYCTIATFSEGELGQPYVETKTESSEQSDIKPDSESVVQEAVSDNVIEKQVC